MEQDPIEKVYLRLKSYLQRLETIISEIVEELDCNRKERNDWFEWHEDWKSAWLNQADDSENQRFITSIKRRNSLFDLKREVSDLKNDLENIRYDREKLLFFLENTNFSQKLEISNLKII